MVVGSLADQIGHEPLSLVPQHVKRLSEAQLAHNIKRQPRKSLAHINTLGSIPPNTIDKSINKFKHCPLHRLQRCLRECDRKHTPFKPMLHLGNRIVGVMNPLDSGIGSVELSLLDIPRVWRVTVDTLQCGGGVETQHVWCDTNDWPIFLVRVVQVQVPIAFPGVPRCVPVGRTRVSIPVMHRPIFCFSGGNGNDKTYQSVIFARKGPGYFARGWNQRRYTTRVRR